MEPRTALACLVTVAACVTAPAGAAQAADACAVYGDAAAGTMDLTFGCPRTSEFSGTSYGTVTWSGTSGSLTLTPPYSLPIGDLTGPCEVEASAHFRCTVSGDGRVLDVEWRVTATTPGRVAGAGTILQLDGPEHYGSGCGYTGFSDLDGDGTATLEFDGGPIVAPGSLVTMTCTLRVGEDVNHSAPPYFEVSSGPAPVAVVPPTVVSYPRDMWLSVCTTVTVDGETWYWANTYYGFWTTDPTRPCTHSTAEYRPEPEIVPIAGLGYLADAILCELVLAPLFPPEGDVFGIWDCPPYA